MKITFLGTGGAFSRADVNYHNNALIETDDGSKILIDCGSTALESLHELDVDALGIDGVIVTHIHADHTGGLEELGFRGMFLGQGQTYDLYIHPSLLPSRSGVDAEVDLWENSLKGGMMHTQDAERNAVRAELESYFTPQIHEDLFRIDTTGYQFVRTDHVPNKDSFGIKIVTEDQTKVFFSADATFMGADASVYQWADVIFHDCMWMPKYPSTVHTHLEELLTLPESIQEKIHLMHYGALEEDHKIGRMSLAWKHKTYEL